MNDPRVEWVNAALIKNGEYRPGIAEITIKAIDDYYKDNYGMVDARVYKQKIASAIESLYNRDRTPDLMHDIAYSRGIYDAVVAVYDSTSG